MSRLGTLRSRIHIFLLGSLLGLVNIVQAQTISGAIGGTVSDPSASAVAGATVTLTNSDTGVKVAETTGANGEFLFAAVLPGRYSIAVEMKGFKKTEKTNLNLT